MYSTARMKVPKLKLPPGRPRLREELFVPVPRPFDFGFTARRPMVPLAAVMLFLNKDAHEVFTLIDDGKLHWAFDIRSARASRREVRVLRESLFDYTGLSPLVGKSRGEKPGFKDIVEIIVPPGIVVSTRDIPLHGTGSQPQNSLSLLLKRRLSAKAIAKLVFPDEPILTATEIAQAFSCDQQHITNLIREKSLRALNIRRGPKASHLVPRSSVIEFLKKRKLS